jgi:hypothetical protein
MSVLGLAPGDWAEWVTGVGTVGAVIFAAQSVRMATRSNKDAQADRAYDEASLVTAESGQEKRTGPGADYTSISIIWTVYATVHNAGRRPISDVSVEILKWPDHSLIHREHIDIIGPSRARRISKELVDNPYSIVVTSGDEKPLLIVTFDFLDSNGRRWIRNLDDVLLTAKTRPRAPWRRYEVSHRSTKRDEMGSSPEGQP